MSVSHCMHHARRIVALPRDQWADQIAELPDGCEHADCGAPRNCRERIREYLRMQWRIRDKWGRKA